MSKRKSKVLSFSPVRAVERTREPQAQLGDPVNYYVKFYLATLEKPVCYQVHKNDWDAVSQAFWEHNENPPQKLIDVIDIEDDTLVRVNPDFVVLYQALYDVGRVEKKQRDGADFDRVTIYIAGLSEPLHFDNMDHGDIASLNEGLDCFDPESQEFVTFVDQDGEDNSIRVESIVLIETPNLLLLDGNVTSWNSATQENETSHDRLEDDEDTDTVI